MKENQIYRSIYHSQVALIPSSAVCLDLETANVGCDVAAEPLHSSIAKLRRRNHSLKKQLGQLAEENDQLREHNAQVRFMYAQLLREAVEHAIVPHIVMRDACLRCEQAGELLRIARFFRGSDSTQCASAKDAFSVFLSSELHVPPILHLSLFRQYQRYCCLYHEPTAVEDVSWDGQRVAERVACDLPCGSQFLTEERMNDRQSRTEEAVSDELRTEKAVSDELRTEKAVSDELRTEKAPSNDHSRPETSRNNSSHTTHFHYPEPCCNETLLVPPWQLGASCTTTSIEASSFTAFWKETMLGRDGKERLFATLARDGCVHYRDLKQMVCDFLYWSESAYDNIHESQATKVPDRTRLCVHACLYITTVAIAILYELNGLTSLLVQRRDMHNSNLVGAFWRHDG